MNRRISRLGLGLLACFAVLFLQLNRVQFFGAEALRDNPENLRAIDRSFSERRGMIQTADGAVVARSVDTPDGAFDRLREYPEGDLYAHVGGYLSYEFGADGVELVFNDELAGLERSQRYRRLSDLVVDHDPTADLTLSLRHDVQEAAKAALGDRRGSVVVLDPRSGAVLALWSWPSFDPNALASHDLDAANATWNRLVDDESDPLLPRAYRERYAPGSTFKVVTAATGLETKVIDVAQPTFPQSTSYLPPLAGSPIGNFNGSTCGGRLIEILSRSCNTAFAQLGAELIGPTRMVEGAARFGFNLQQPFDLPLAAPAVFPVEYGAEVRPGVFEDSARLAQASIGQNDVSASPLSMAMVAAAVAGDGRMWSPYVLDRVVARDGTVLRRVTPAVWRTAVSPSTASVLRDGMIATVEGGTATALRTSGLTIGAKTGTAEVGQGAATNAWVIGFAGPAGQPAAVAFAVLVEADAGIGEQTGGAVAAPIARAVVEAALRPMPSVQQSATRS